MVYKRHPGITFVIILNVLFLLFLGYTLFCHPETFAIVKNYIHPMTMEDWSIMEALPDERVASTELTVAVTAIRGVISVANIAACSYILLGAANGKKRTPIYPFTKKEIVAIFALVYVTYQIFISGLMVPMFSDAYPCIWMPLADNFFLPALFAVLVCYGEYKARKARKNQPL